MSDRETAAVSVSASDNREVAEELQEVLRGECEPSAWMEGVRGRGGKGLLGIVSENLLRAASIEQIEAAIPKDFVNPKQARENAKRAKIEARKASLLAKLEKLG